MFAISAMDGTMYLSISYLVAVYKAIGYLPAYKCHSLRRLGTDVIAVA